MNIVPQDMIDAHQCCLMHYSKIKKMLTLSRYSLLKLTYHHA